MPPFGVCTVTLEPVFKERAWINLPDVPKWEKFWQNLRMSRESELILDGKLDICIVAMIIGNDPLVMYNHYFHLTSDDYKKAADYSPTRNTETS